MIRNNRLLTLSTLILLLVSCIKPQNVPTASLAHTPTPSQPVTITPFPTTTSTPKPTNTIPPPTFTPELVDDYFISKEKLDCEYIGNYANCKDDVLEIAFEYPIAWGDAVAELRHGETGFSYQYHFENDDKSLKYLAAGGRSKDWTLGREKIWTDFAGFGNSFLQTRFCEWRDAFPICEEINPNVVWMIRLLNDNYLCEVWQYYPPFFRIEVNLPDNSTINGFVFEAPFLSDQLLEEVNTNLYSIIDIDTQVWFMKDECDSEERKAFNIMYQTYLERIQNRSLDEETLFNLDGLIHLANSITWR